MQESAYGAAKDYLSKLENNKWKMNLDDQKMTDLNTRTQKALSNLLLKRNVSGGRHEASNLLLHNLKKLNQKKTIIDIGELDPLVQVYEEKIHNLERESKVSEQEQTLLRDAVETLVEENQALRNKMEGLIRREILVCQNSRKYIEEVEGQKKGMQGKVEYLEREKGKDLMKVMDSLEMYKQEIEGKEAEILALEDLVNQVKKDLREAVRREKRLVEENESLVDRNRELQKEGREKAEMVADMEEQSNELREIKELLGEENPNKIKRTLEKMMMFGEGEGKEVKESKEEIEGLKEMMRDMEEEMELMKIEKKGEKERREVVEEELENVKARAQGVEKEKMGLFKKLKETEMQLKSLEGSTEGRGKAFEALTEKLKKVIQKKTEKIEKLENAIESQERQFKGETEKEFKDQQREKDQILRREREETEKRESLERTMLVKDEVIKGLKKERDFYKERAETKLEGIPDLKELEEQNKTLQAKCDNYMKLNVNMAHKNKKLKEDLDSNLNLIDDMQKELESLKEMNPKLEVGPPENESDFDETIEYKKSQNFFFNKKKANVKSPKIDLNYLLKVTKKKLIT
jgi:chromosome segregation ATPase